jgi:hypothetical protein
VTGNLVITLLFDCGLAALLVTTIRYCAKLSSRIRILQDSRGELAGMIARFDTATSRAVASVAELQSISKKITDALQLKIDKANFLADDLAFLIEKSNKIVLQLEQQAKMAANESKKLAERAELGSHSQKHFDKIVAQVVASPPARPAAAMPEKAKPTQNAFAVQPHHGPAISDRLEAVIKAEAKLLPRTGAERELLEALKSRL